MTFRVECTCDWRSRDFDTRAEAEVELVRVRARLAEDDAEVERWYRQGGLEPPVLPPHEPIVVEVLP